MPEYKIIPAPKQQEPTPHKPTLMQRYRSLSPVMQVVVPSAIIVGATAITEACLLTGSETQKATDLVFHIPQPGEVNMGLDANEYKHLQETQADFVSQAQQDGINSLDNNGQTNVQSIIANNISSRSGLDITPEQVDFSPEDQNPFWITIGDQTIDFIPVQVNLQTEGNTENTQKLFFLFAKFPNGEWGQVGFLTEPPSAASTNGETNVSYIEFLDITQGDQNIAGLISAAGNGKYGFVSFNETTDTKQPVIGIGLPGETDLQWFNFPEDSVFEVAEPSSSSSVRFARFKAPETSSMPDTTITPTPSAGENQNNTASEAPGNPLTEITTDQFGNQYITTDKGFYYLNEETNTWQAINIDNQESWPEQIQILFNTTMRTELDQLVAQNSGLSADEQQWWADFPEDFQTFDQFIKMARRSYALQTTQIGLNWEQINTMSNEDLLIKIFEYKQQNPDSNQFTILTPQEIVGFMSDPTNNQVAYRDGTKVYDGYVASLGLTTENMDNITNITRDFQSESFTIPIFGTETLIPHFVEEGIRGILMGMSPIPGISTDKAVVAVIGIRDPQTNKVIKLAPITVLFDDTNLPSGSIYASVGNGLSIRSLDKDVLLSPTKNLQGLVDLVLSDIENNISHLVQTSIAKGLNGQPVEGVYPYEGPNTPDSILFTNTTYTP